MDFKKKEIIGMIHLAGPDTESKAMDEIGIYEEEGLSGIIIENYHGGMLDVINVLEKLKSSPTTMSVGLNILPNEYRDAFNIGTKYNIDFIQLDFVSGLYRPNRSLDELDFMNAKSGTGISVYGGVWPKYYQPLEGSVLEDDIEDAFIFAEAIVVTGAGTGKETPLDKVKTFRKIMNDLDHENIPLIVGAGLNPLNLREQLEIAQGAIVGSAFKPNGRTQQMVDRDLVKIFMEQVQKL